MTTVPEGTALPRPKARGRGHYVVRRLAVDGRRVFYLTRAGGWTLDNSRAQRFGDRASAIARLGNRCAHISWRPGRAWE